MEKFIMVSDCAIRINDGEEVGHMEQQNEDKRPVLMLLHGYLESMDVWEGFVDLLMPHLRVVMMDLPGHGISNGRGEVHTMEFMASSVKGVLDNLKIDRCVLLGHSMGGYIALEFLSKYSEVLSGIILLNSTPDADSPGKRDHRDREIEAVLAGKKELLASSISQRFAPDNLVLLEDRVEELIEQASMTEDQGVVAILRGARDRADHNKTMRETKVPQLLIFGRKDGFITVEVATKIIENQPQAKVFWLDNSGHMASVEEPKETAQAIVEFCNSVW